MIKENVLGVRFRFSSSCADPRISPLPAQYERPRPSLLIIATRTFLDAGGGAAAIFRCTMHECSRSTWTPVAGSGLCLTSTRPDRFTFFRATCGATLDVQLPPGREPRRPSAHRAGLCTVVETAALDPTGALDPCSSARRHDARRHREKQRRRTERAGRRRRKAFFQLRAFQPQQLKHTLSELELPRLLAPDLPSD